MTPLLAVPRETVVRGVARSDAELAGLIAPRSPVCAAPFCGRPSTQRHHIIARSRLRAAYDWIEIEGYEHLVRNVADLCAPCHEKVESTWGGCDSRIRWINGAWAWYDRIIIDYDSTYRDTDLDNRIVWIDRERNTAWKLRGFLGGSEWTTKPP